MKHYDVGIYGLWYGHNYGSMITYYALSKVMESMGLSYAMIRNPLETETNIDELHKAHPLVFAQNRYEITPLIPIDDMNQLNDYFDIFLIGSDQMWNYYLSKPYRQSYFLDFAYDDKIKISYATSFGLNEYVGPPEEKEITKKNLHRFDKISVRDDFSQRICNDEFELSADLLLDPVFLCPVEKYEELIDEVDFSENDDYIFAYILNPNERIGAEIKKIAENASCRIVVVFDFGGNKEQQKNSLNVNSELVDFIILPDVKEWIYLFKNASFILTDSFHGTCFSIIFKKNFITLKNNARGGSRFDFLLSEFRLQEHLIENPEELSEKYLKLNHNYRINYDLVWKDINYQKAKALEWLKEALNKKSKKKVKLEFEYNSNIWEEHFILGKTVLFTVHEQSPGGNYAVLPLKTEILKGNHYHLSIRFRLKTTSPVFSLHVMKKGTKNIQIIYTHRITNSNSEKLTELNFDFTAEDDYDSFMIGAMQLSGEKRYFMIEDLYIESV